MADSEASTPDQQQPEIVLRWEWRTFGGELGSLHGPLDGRVPESVQDAEDLYLLSRLSDASVKVRDEVMDVKQLERVDDDGLELWRPVMKAGFPLSADDTASVLRALNVPVSSLRRDAYTLDDLLDEIVATDPRLLAVLVHKRRAHHRVDGCMIESTDVRVGHRTSRTIAVESPDPAQVSATVGTLGLDGRRNVNVAQGLKALVGFGARRYAVVDVGTNSVKFHLGVREADGTVRTVADRAEVTRLGEGLDETGQFGREPMERTVDAVVAMVDQARREDASAVAAVGTAGLRRAANRATFVDAVRARCGVTVEVISGEEEARLAYLATTSALPRVTGRLAVFDTGGGSSQFTFGRDDRVEQRFSLEVGAVRFAERYGLDGPVSETAVGDALDAIAADLHDLADCTPVDAVIGMGGTATNLAAVKHCLGTYDAEVVHGTVLDLAEIDRQVELYRTRGAEERRQIVGLQPNRGEVILAGACVVRTILRELGVESFTVSDRGLRHRLFRERFGQ